MMDFHGTFSDDFVTSTSLFDLYQPSQNFTAAYNDSNEVIMPNGPVGLDVHSSVQSSYALPNEAGQTSEKHLHNPSQLKMFSQKQPNTSQNMQSSLLVRSAPTCSLRADTLDATLCTSKYQIMLQRPKELLYTVCNSSYNDQPVSVTSVAHNASATNNQRNQAKGHPVTWNMPGTIKDCSLINGKHNHINQMVPSKPDQGGGLKRLCINPSPLVTKAKLDEGFSTIFLRPGDGRHCSNTGNTELLALPNVQNYSVGQSVPNHSSFLWNKNPVSLQSFTKPTTTPSQITFQNNKLVMASKVVPRPNDLSWRRCNWNPSGVFKNAAETTKPAQSLGASVDWWMGSMKSCTRSVSHQTKPEYQVTTNHPKWRNYPRNDTFNLEDFLSQESDQDALDCNQNMLMADVDKPVEIEAIESSDSSSDSSEDEDLDKDNMVSSSEKTRESASCGEQWFKTCQRMLEDIDREVASLEDNIIPRDDKVVNRSFEIMEDDVHLRQDCGGLSDLPEVHIAERALMKSKSQTSKFLENGLTPLRAHGKRKCLTPVKSPRAKDPTFRGVVVKMKTELQDDRAHLDIRAYFSCKKNCRRHQHLKKRYLEPIAEKAQEQPAFAVAPSSHTERDFLPKERRRRCPLLGKQCASCGTKKTPLWRDAEDGTSLCNACGIRFKKYRVRCTTCWHIPRKDTKTDPACHRCGEILKVPPLSHKTVL